jgi:methyl-accepting chemotaxis protein
VLVLVAGMVTTLIERAWTAHRSLQDYTKVAERMMAAAEFGSGLGHYLTERQWTGTALNAAQPAGAAQWEQIRGSRTRAAGLERGGNLIAGLADPAGAQAIRALLADVPRLRAEADRLLALPQQDRPPAAARDYMQETRRLVDNASAAWLGVLPKVAGDHGALQMRAEILALGWRLRDAAGLARGEVSASLQSGRPAEPERIARIEDLRSRARQLSEMLQLYAESGRLLPVGVAAIRNMRSSLLGEGGLDATIRQINAAWSAGQRPNYDVDRWMELSNGALADMTAVMIAVEAGVRRVTEAGMAEAEARRNTALALVLLGLVLGAAVIAMISLRLARPLNRLTSTVTRLAAREEGLVVPDTQRRDEMGVLARALAQFQVQQAEADAMRAAAEQEREAARRAQDEALSRMAESIESNTRGGFARITEQMAQMRAEAEEAAAGAARVGETGAGAADAAGAALSASETVAAAAEEMAVSIREISQRMEEAASLTRSAVEGASNGTRTVRGLEEAVQKIGRVVDLISDIAGRTNLLALNATIEAARAGEAGKGFAVVASEVKSLASQTARATQEIGQQIAEVQGETARAVAAIGQIGETVQGLEQIAAGVAAAMTEQSSATQEIARAISSAADAARSVSTRVATLGDDSRGAVTRAERMRGTAAAATGALDEARTVIVRSVREACEAVERRRTPRARLSLRADLELGGRSQAVELIDLGEGGAAIVPVAGLHPGMSAGLRLPGLPTVPGTILAVEPDRIRLGFRAEGATLEALRRELVRHGVAAAKAA